VEWSARLDAHGAPEYIEYWRTLASSRDGPFLALRRRASTTRPAAYFLVCGDHWAYAADRPPGHRLPTVTPGEGGHPADRGRVEPLVAAAEAAGDREALLSLLSMECHYGSLNALNACAETKLLGPIAPEPARAWPIVLSTMPWREGTHFDVSSLYGQEWEIFDEKDLTAPGSPPPPNARLAILGVVNARNPDAGPPGVPMRMDFSGLGGKRKHEAAEG